MKKEDLYKNSTFDFFKFMLFDAYLAIPLALFIGYKIFQALPGNYFLAFMPLLLAGYLIFDIEITEITSTNKKFEKEELDYLKSKKFNFLYKSFNVINENSFTFIAVNKQKFYLHTKFTFLGEGKPTEIRKIYNLSDISSGYLKIHTDKREKISKKSMFKKGVAGGLIFGWKGVIAGALLSDINEDEIKVTSNIQNNKDPNWGTTRAIVANIINGVTNGFTKTLELNGTGYRASVSGSKLKLELGYSHDINFDIPEGIKIAVEKQTTLKITGSDKQLVGEVASKIKTLRKIEPYKGKGVREKGQYVLKKEGKKK